MLITTLFWVTLIKKRLIFYSIQLKTELKYSSIELSYTLIE